MSQEKWGRFNAFHKLFHKNSALPSARFALQFSFLFAVTNIYMILQETPFFSEV